MRASETARQLGNRKDALAGVGRGGGTWQTNSKDVRLGVVDRPVRSRTVGLRTTTRTLGRQAASIDRPLVDRRHTLGDVVASVDICM
jgi:hypothetical protein